MDTQVDRTYKLLKKAGSKGVHNHDFPRHHLLRYSHYISELRQDGHTITVERLKLKNGRWSNTYIYKLVEDE